MGSDSLVRELALTGRKLGAEEAARLGLVSRVSAAVLDEARAMARTIAEKSPVATLGVKQLLNYSPLELFICLGQRDRYARCSKFWPFQSRLHRQYVSGLSG